MTKNYWEGSFWIFPRKCIRICLASAFSSASDSMVAQTCMANTGIVYLDADFVRFWCFHFNVFDGEVLACFPGYGSLKGRQLHAIKAPLGIQPTLQVIVWPKKESVNDVRTERLCARIPFQQYPKA